MHVTRWNALAAAMLGLMVGAAGRTEAGIIIGNYPTTGDGNVIDMEEHSVGAGWTMPAGTAV